METIEVQIGKNHRGTYIGLGGTFASMSYCCLRKKALPGFHEKDIIKKAEMKDGKLLRLVLTGKHKQDKLMAMMEIALPNIGAYPDTGGKAAFFIEVKSEK
jgi:hypothetical protein